MGWSSLLGERTGFSVLLARRARMGWFSLLGARSLRVSGSPEDRVITGGSRRPARRASSLRSAPLGIRARIVGCSSTSMSSSGSPAGRCATVVWASVSVGLRGRALAAAVKSDCLFATRPMVGSYGPFADLVAEVVGQWPGRRVAHAVRATLMADVALKNTTISTEEGILTDLVLTLAASRPRKAA